MSLENNKVQKLVIAVCAFFCCGTLAAAQEQPLPDDTYPSRFHSLDERIKTLKKDMVDLSREFSSLEDELLFPSQTQVAVFVSVAADTAVDLDAVTLAMDEREVASHLYSPREVNALQRGGVQRLYIGNLTRGEHALSAHFLGKDAHGHDIRGDTSVTFTKKNSSEFIELTIGSGADRTAAFRVKQWE